MSLYPSSESHQHFVYIIHVVLDCPTVICEHNARSWCCHELGTLCDYLVCVPIISKTQKRCNLCTIIYQVSGAPGIWVLVQLTTTALQLLLQGPREQVFSIPKAPGTSPSVTLVIYAVTSPVSAFSIRLWGPRGIKMITHFVFYPVPSAQWHSQYKVLNTCNASGS